VLLDARIACFTKDVSQDVLLTDRSNESKFARDRIAQRMRLEPFKNFPALMYKYALNARVRVDLQNREKIRSARLKAPTASLAEEECFKFLDEERRRLRKL